MDQKNPHTATYDTPLPLVLAGARGHGRWHLENIRRLQDKGIVRLAGICELTPLGADEIPDGLGTPEQSADFGALLDSTGAAIAVICTPIPTHTDLALTAAQRGVHVLLEKPPAPSYAEFRRMADGVAEAGVVCQIGFQSLGSHAVPAIRKMVAQGLIGEVVGIGGAGAWARAEAYYRRAPWAGKRRLNGVDVIDGALTNPLAHAVATGLALGGADRAEDVTAIETELLRANDIESDDTSCVRITTADGGRITVAVTLCAEDPGEPYNVVHGTSGRITFWYKQDRVLVQRAGHGPEEIEYHRTDLLENLVDHLVDGADLLVPPDVTGAFMKVVEAIRVAPDPIALPAEAWHRPADEDRRVVDGIDGLVVAAADNLALYSELGASWALPAAPAKEVST
ncbi:Gfo/Idh/MocA family protein [Streptomyces europaeiscabiei]|uniref:Gfo/Idh/MocA family protein n=1 Tax=Streptomyces europaeiscabiei TaxID=146819 RepID=UPI000D1B4D14|nr:Gfo/Idh/MocA family oxidoreductase [Streptomyces europaeiscabiei]MDX2529471.1 Gfo/Idh/MocA family oxidoreductase [Streptomyces europaeiscabiei]MDX2761902.1 Gfo/Idh/MocA family oxidoreductase [Streptomyces europaeiscabiei]MDX3671508.1 Gfo/Idh/MocA family oxidoreductase [Streptomyces europaeiscabiei]MDX3709414.1 Gfo/Idh/MocA family oxidoreductase [Streptomyces europaeiscabiei]MDX3778775.1 Gfo/Idh/MocA family oxidoreductase [Streptomyces europaeiscabiei]